MTGFSSTSDSVGEYVHNWGNLHNILVICGIYQCRNKTTGPKNLQNGANVNVVAKVRKTTW